VLDFDGRKAYVRKDKIGTFKRIDGVVFDCDGVLVDIRDSYNSAISKTVAYILTGLTGCKVPETWVTEELIYGFRKTGGFNNDWDTVYGILMFTLSNLPQEAQIRLKMLMEVIEWQQNPYERLILMRNAAEREFQPNLCDSVLSEEMMNQLLGFTSALNETGVASVDWNLVDKYGGNESFFDFFHVLVRFLHTPAKVGQSLIATVFEEFFCGSNLFWETFRIEPKFNFRPGKIENEKLIIRTETIDRLVSFLGKNNLGIASGSRKKPARHVLGALLDKFNREALVFLEDMEAAERKRSEKEGQKVSLKKPNPFSLLKAVEGFGNYNLVLYVGDSMEDVIIVDKARKTGKPFLSVGVYEFSGVGDIVRDSFLKAGCDMVIPSVNELPFILETLRR
jgi:HAD superfamily phosphatase